jgi:hypothetical protein|tara:strand:- start:643 stop:1011 length:369 start_codon:yes stop_codon:yes gene_type:complete
MALDKVLDNAISLQVNNAYFEKFKSKDLTYLSTIYAPTIRLADWNGEWHGIDNVLAENAEFFRNEFTLTVIRTSKFYAEFAPNPIGYSNVITIEVGGETFNIVDELVFDDDYKILSIYATQQ